MDVSCQLHALAALPPGKELLLTKMLWYIKTSWHVLSPETIEIVTHPVKKSLLPDIYQTRSVQLPSDLVLYCSTPLWVGTPNGTHYFINPSIHNYRVTC